MQLYAIAGCSPLLCAHNEQQYTYAPPGPWAVPNQDAYCLGLQLFWALALGHLIGQPTGLLGVQWWKLCTHILFYSCYLFYMPNPFRNLGLAQVGPGFVRGSQLCIHSTCGKRACNQNIYISGSGKSGAPESICQENS